MAVIVEQQDATVAAVEQSAIDVEQNTKGAYVVSRFSLPVGSNNALGSITPNRLLFMVRFPSYPEFNVHTDLSASSVISERKVDLLWYLCVLHHCPRYRSRCGVWDKEVVVNLRCICSR